MSDRNLIKKNIPTDILGALSHLSYEDFPYETVHLHTQELIEIYTELVRTGKDFDEINLIYRIHFVKQQLMR